MSSLRIAGPALVVCLVVSSASFAQQTGPRREITPDSARIALALGFRTLSAARITGAAPVLDGRLDDPVWQTAPVAGDFVEQNPTPGILPAMRTDFRVAYDDRALYLAIRAYDDHPDSIIAPYPRRDDETRSDWIFVEIDSRHDRRTGFGFGVNPRGVQVDATFDQYINYDNAWNGVWQAVPRVDSLGWSVEYRIPFSQLSYVSRPGAPLTFGLNVYRKTSRTGESSDWSPRLPTYADLVSHFNDLTGIQPPPSPERLEVVPYTAAKVTYAPRVTGDPFSNAQETDGYAGADFRYRVTSGFALTGAIHPDFGQVEADPSQVNLTTFETFFAEQRPFFVEGESQFAFDISLPFQSRNNSFASEQPFYSRRIGRPPHGSVPSGAAFSDVPTSTTILGAAKLSGRTVNGWSIGAMGAVTGSEAAQFVDSLGVTRRATVDPTTEIGVFRIARQSADGGSGVGAIVTGLNRSSLNPGLDSIVARQALSFGADGRRRFGGGDWEASGFVLGSHLAGSASAVSRVLQGPGHFFQRPDATYLVNDSSRTSISGVAAQARLARVGGAFRWAMIGHLISPGFEVNDVGFERNADWLIAMGSWSYERYQPGRFIRHWAVGSDRLGAGWSFGGERRAAIANASMGVDLRNYWAIVFNATHEFPSLSLEELRGGPALMLPQRTDISETLYTDSRRPWRVVLGSTQSFEPGSGSHSFDLAPSITWRATDRLALSLGPEFAHAVNGWQYVDQRVELSAPNRRHYILGRLDETTTSLTARMDFAFSSRMTLQLYAQPFLSAGRYGQFKEVRSPRAANAEDRLTTFLPQQISYDPVALQYRVDLDGDGASDLAFAKPDFNRKAFNGTLIFRWEYSPGSTLYLIWTQERNARVSDGSFQLDRDAGRLFRAPATNVLLVKASYRLVW